MRSGVPDFGTEGRRQMRYSTPLAGRPHASTQSGSRTSVAKDPIMTATEPQPHTDAQAHSPAPGVLPESLVEKPSDGRVTRGPSRRLSRTGVTRLCAPNPDSGVVTGNGQSMEHRDRLQRNAV